MSKRIAAKGATEAFLRAHVAHEADDCLPWPFCKNDSGYGLAVVAGKQAAASRWMCRLAHGEPPAGRYEAAHACGRPDCVNPKHLRWDTPKGNQADRMRHGTHNLGERNGNTKLTAADVAAIRAAPPDIAALVARYGVSKGCISKIRSGSRWRGAENGVSWSDPTEKAA